MRIASAPCRVWAYDATALRGPSRSIWYRLFVMLDLLSRYCPGWMVVSDERGELVADWIAGVVATHGPAEPGHLTTHADRGSAMTSKPVAYPLADLGITKSHGRPHVSNDCDDGLTPSKAGPDPSQ